MNIPPSENALLIRTDFSDQTAWDTIKATVSKPADPFTFDMEVVDDPANERVTADQLITALPKDYSHSFIVLADGISMSQLGHPVLFVDLLEHGRLFRAIAREVAAIHNNLSVANMAFEEFADLVDETGVFRGMPGV